MARGMNHIFLVGAIARPAEADYIGAQNTPVLRLTIAGEDQVVAQDGRTISLPWYHQVSMLGASAERLINQEKAGQLQAGDIVMVQGSLDYRSWNDKDTNLPRNALSVKAARIDAVTRDNPELVTDTGGGIRLKNGLNEVILIGNLGRDAEVRSTGSGDVASFSIAVTESWKDASKQGGWAEKTHWVELTLWRELVEVARTLKKGASVMVIGRLKNESWTDTKTGAKRSTTKVEVSRIEVLARGLESAQGQTQTTPSSGRGAYAATGGNAAGSRTSNLNINDNAPLPEEDEDIPF